MRVFALILTLIAFHLLGGVVAAALPHGGGDAVGNFTKVVSLGVDKIEMLVLPDGFDITSHQALNLSHLIELRQADPQAILPELPENLTTVMADIETKVFCETTWGSPQQIYVIQNGVTLNKIGDAWCCQNSAQWPCTKMTKFNTAATDICAMQGRCVKCDVAGSANLLIAANCVNNGRAGGYVR
jgi:hypothetical protein